MQTRERKTKEQSKKIGNVFFRTELDIKQRYDQHCINKGYSVGRRLRALMKADLDGKIEIQ